MTWAIPGWYALILLALTVFRIWRICAEDEIADPIRDRIAPSDSRLEHFLICPWCFGFWLSLGAWLFWIWQPHWTLVVSVPFAISALVGTLGSRLN